MNRDIEETRHQRKQMREMEVLVEKIEAILVGQSAHLAVGALTSALGRVMYQTQSPVEYIARGLSLIVDMCDEQVKRDSEET